MSEIIAWLVLLPVLAAIGYLLLKINDKIHYSKAFELKKEIIEKLTKNCKNLKQENVIYHKENKVLLDLLSTYAKCDVSKIPTNTKLVDIFCVSKKSLRYENRIESIIYANETHYCPNIYSVYLSMETIYQKYLKENPKVDRRALNEKLFTKLLDEDEVVDYILELDIENFLKFSILVY